MPYQQRSGLGNSASYQVSGKPFATGSLSIAPADPPLRIPFPQVTRWISIVNHDATGGSKQRALRIAFSEAGLPSGGGTNYFTIWDGTTSYTYWQMPRLEVKITELWVEGHSDQFDVIAGLTGISTSELATGWSGS